MDLDLEAVFSLSPASQLVSKGQFCLLSSTHEISFDLDKMDRHNKIANQIASPSLCVCVLKTSLNSIASLLTDDDLFLFNLFKNASVFIECVAK